MSRRKKQEDEEKAKLAKKQRVQIAIGAGVGSVIVIVVLFFVIRSATKTAPAVYNQDPVEIKQNEIRALEKLRDSVVEKATKAGQPAAEIEKMKALFQTEIDKVTKREAK